MVFLLVREITIERAFLLPVKGASVIESPERGREQIYRDPIQIPLSSNRAERGRKVNVLALSLNLQIETQITSSKRFRVIIHPLKTTGIETITYVKQKYKNQKYQQLTNHIHIKKKQFQLTLTIYVNTPKTLFNKSGFPTIQYISIKQTSSILWISRLHSSPGWKRVENYPVTFKRDKRAPFHYRRGGFTTYRRA